MQAAQTGHLVLSTLHTDDAPSCVTRLTDIGIEPYVTASALIGVIAQRLVRRLCTHCKRPYTPEAETLRAMSMSEAEAATLTFYRAVGCDQCNQTGYRGRVGIYEIMVVTDELRRTIAQRGAEARLREAALAAGMISLGEDGLLKVKAGVTTPQELLRVVTEVRRHAVAVPGVRRSRVAGFRRLPELRTACRRRLPALRQAGQGGMEVLSVLREEHRSSPARAPRKLQQSAPRPRASGREQRRRVQEIADRLPASVAQLLRTAGRRLRRRRPTKSSARSGAKSPGTIPTRSSTSAREFQEIAAVKAAELTQAYKTLSDESLRADYDAQLEARLDAPASARTARGQPPPSSATAAPAADGARAGDPGVSRRDRVGTSDLMRKAAVQRFRQAVSQEFGQCEETPIPGLRLRCARLPKSGFLSRIVPPRLLARVRRRRSTPSPCRKAGRWPMRLQEGRSA